LVVAGLSHWYLIWCAKGKKPVLYCQGTLEENFATAKIWQGGGPEMT